MAVTNPDDALTTTAAAKVYLKIGNTNDDTVIAALVSRYSAVVSTYCDRRFAATTYTNERYDGTGTENLYLRAFPVTTMTSIYLDSARDFAAGSLLVADDDYYVVPEDGHGLVVRLNGVWDKGVAVIKATYVAGYATIPGPVIEATHRLIARAKAWSDMGTHAVSAQSIQAGGGSVSFVEHDIPKDVKKLLEPYRKTRIRG